METEAPRTSRTPRERRRAVLALAVPALGSLAVEPLYVLVDTAIVGRLGTAPLGGLAIASTVLTTSFWAFNFLAYGTTARVAQLSGRGDRRAASSVALQGLWLSVVVSAVVVPLILAFGRPVAALLGGEGDVLDAAATYLRISALGMPFVLVTLVGHGYLRGRSDTRTPLWVALFANVANVVVEVWFVFGLDMGVAGSALSTVLAQGAAAAVFVWIVARDARRAGAGVRLDADAVRWLLRSGHQLVVRTGALLATLALATAVAARVGDATLAGHQIAIQVWAFLALGLDALAISAQAMVGTALGAGDPAEARAVGRTVVRTSLVVGLALCAAVLASSPVLPSAFTSEREVVAVATVALAGVALTQVPAAWVFALDGILIGAADFRFLKWGTLAGLAAFLPFAVGVLVRPSLGVAGVWAGLLAWLLARLAVNGARFAGERWTQSA